MAQTNLKPFYQCIGYIIRKAKHPRKLRNKGPLVLIKVNSHDQLGKALVKGRSLAKSSLPPTCKTDGTVVAYKANMPCLASTGLKKTPSNLLPKGISHSIKTRLKSHREAKVSLPDLKARVSWLNLSKVKILNINELHDRDAVEEQFRRLKLIKEQKANQKTLKVKPAVSKKDGVQRLKEISGSCKIQPVFNKEIPCKEHQDARLSEVSDCTKLSEPCAKLAQEGHRKKRILEQISSLIQNNDLESEGSQSNQKLTPQAYHFKEILNSSKPLQISNKIACISESEPNTEKKSQDFKYVQMKKSSSDWKHSKPSRLEPDEFRVFEGICPHSNVTPCAIPPPVVLKTQSPKEAKPLVPPKVENTTEVAQSTSQDHQEALQTQRITKGALEITKKVLEKRADYEAKMQAENAKPLIPVKDCVPKPVVKKKSDQISPAQDLQTFSSLLHQMKSQQKSEDVQPSMESLYVRPMEIQPRCDNVFFKPPFNVHSKMKTPYIESDSPPKRPEVKRQMSLVPCVIESPQSSKVVEKEAELSKYGFVKSYLEGLTESYLVSQPTILTANDNENSQLVFDAPTTKSQDPENYSFREKVFRYFHEGNNFVSFSPTITTTSLSAKVEKMAAPVAKKEPSERGKSRAEPSGSDLKEEVTAVQKAGYSSTTFNTEPHYPSKIVIRKKPQAPPAFKYFRPEEKEAIKKAIGASATKITDDSFFSVESLSKTSDKQSQLRDNLRKNIKRHPIDIVKVEASKMLEKEEPKSQKLGNEKADDLDIHSPFGLQARFNEVIEGLRNSCKNKKKLQEEKIVEEQTKIHDTILSSIALTSGPSESVGVHGVMSINDSKTMAEPRVFKKNETFGTRPSRRHNTYHGRKVMDKEMSIEPGRRVLRNPFSTTDGPFKKHSGGKTPPKVPKKPERPCLVNPFQPTNNQEAPTRPPGAPYNPFEVPLGKKTGRPCQKNPFWISNSNATPEPGPEEKVEMQNVNKEPGVPGCSSALPHTSLPTKILINSRPEKKPKPMIHDPKNPFRDILEGERQRELGERKPPAFPVRVQDHRPQNCQFNGEWRKQSDHNKSTTPSATTSVSSSESSNPCVNRIKIKTLPVNDNIPKDNPKKAAFVTRKANPFAEIYRNPCPKKNDF